MSVMVDTVCLHLDETITALATPGVVRSDTISIVENDSRGKWKSFTLKEQINILQRRVSYKGSNVCAYACILHGFECFHCRVVISPGRSNPLKGDVIILLLVTLTKPLYMLRSELVVWCLRLVKMLTINIVLKFRTFMRATSK